MRVLALDTALHACSVAVIDHGRVLARRFERRARGHAEALLPMVEAVRTEAGLEYRELDLLAVTVGPGLFIGLRIGLAAARGLALAAKLPLVGITTLEAIAAAAVDAGTAADRPIYVAIDARGGEFYGQAFAPDLAPLGAPGRPRLADVRDRLPPRAIVVGSAARLIESQLADPGTGPEADAGVGHDQGYRFRDQPADPDAAVVARIAARRGRPKDRAGPVGPLYLRDPDATPRS